jgi:hypothetical protein
MRACRSLSLSHDLFMKAALTIVSPASDSASHFFCTRSRRVGTKLNREQVATERHYDCAALVSPPMPTWRHKRPQRPPTLGPFLWPV